MKLLMIGHLLGDFYFQPDCLVKKKKESFIWVILHCIIYSAVIGVMLLPKEHDIRKYVFLILLITVSHLIIDIVKIIIDEKCKPGGCKMIIFLFDQIAHLLILLVISQMCGAGINASLFAQISEWLPTIVEKFVDFIVKNQIIIFSFLLCGKPSAILVSLVFGLIPKTMKNAKKRRGNKKITNSDEQEGMKIGSWIGILEREIILILGLLGEYEAIGFVIAAKSLARHSQFDNPAFAEKYLVGTLLSTLIAILGIVLCSII